MSRLRKTMQVMLQLIDLLRQRTYKSNWDI
jgi:hypothetical protein